MYVYMVRKIDLSLKCIKSIFLYSIFACILDASLDSRCHIVCLSGEALGKNMKTSLSHPASCSWFKSGAHIKLANVAAACVKVGPTAARTLVKWPLELPQRSQYKRKPRGAPSDCRTTCYSRSMRVKTCYQAKPDLQPMTVNHVTLQPESAEKETLCQTNSPVNPHETFLSCSFAGKFTPCWLCQFASSPFGFPTHPLDPIGLMVLSKGCATVPQGPLTS